ncbi:hypothetical protein NDU88_001325 [Pleurodeles waltl]|uniref:Uncharacterized protein n=1 Tax=Pleurodeles waltl TaxID=8319 RepID=A0AAV7P6G7_PLEWA|nr:hypothetical protein NDU88_001325 [Pleurodeles waltl]
MPNRDQPPQLQRWPSPAAATLSTRRDPLSASVVGPTGRRSFHAFKLGPAQAPLAAIKISPHTTGHTEGRGTTRTLGRCLRQNHKSGQAASPDPGTPPQAQHTAHGDRQSPPGTRLTRLSRKAGSQHQPHSAEPVPGSTAESVKGWAPQLPPQTPLHVGP